jgi:hypothetical protein
MRACQHLELRLGMKATDREVKFALSKIHGSTANAQLSRSRRLFYFEVNVGACLLERGILAR